MWVENLNSKMLVLLSDLGFKILGFLQPHFRVFGNCRVLGRFFFVAYFSWQLDNMELKTNFFGLVWFENFDLKIIRLLGVLSWKIEEFNNYVIYI